MGPHPVRLARGAGFGLSYQSLTRNIRARNLCPPRRGNRKGVVEKVNHTAAQRWWRTLADDMTAEAAQAGLDRFARVGGDTRIRATADGRSSVAVVAKTELLRPVLAAPYQVIVSETRTASWRGLVSYRGNRYSVPLELATGQVVVSHPVGGQFCDIATAGWIVIARHRLAADGLGVMVRDTAMSSPWTPARWPTRLPGARRKERIPPGPAAKAAAAEALPAVLGQATAENLSLTVAPERLLDVEVEAGTPDGWPGGCGSPACPPRPPWPTSMSMPPPGSTEN